MPFKLLVPPSLDRKILFGLGGSVHPKFSKTEYLHLHLMSLFLVRLITNNRNMSTSMRRHPMPFCIELIVPCVVLSFTYSSYCRRADSEMGVAPGKNSTFSTIPHTTLEETWIRNSFVWGQIFLSSWGGRLAVLHWCRSDSDLRLYCNWTTMIYSNSLTALWYRYFAWQGLKTLIYRKFFQLKKACISALSKIVCIL